MPIDVMVGSPPESKPNLSCPIEYVEWLRNSLNHVYQYASEQLNVHAKRQKEYYDLKAKPTSYPVGSFVWRWYWPAARGKLSKGWVGPFKILECPTQIHCVIQLTPTSPKIRVHIDALKPHHGAAPSVWLPAESSSSDLETDNEYEHSNSNAASEHSDSPDSTIPSSEDEMNLSIARPNQNTLGKRIRKPPNRYSP